MTSLPLFSKVAPWYPSHSYIRTVKDFNRRSKKPMHIMRAKLMKFTEYTEPKEKKTMAEMCRVHQKSMKIEPENPTQIFYAKLCRHTFERSKVIAIFHNEGLDKEDMFNLRRRLIKHDMYVKMWGVPVVTEAISDSKFKNFQDTLSRHNLYVTSDKPVVKDLLKVTKRFGRIHLLGGLIEDCLMSPQQMKKYSDLPSLELAHGQLSSILNSSVNKTYSLLQSNQQGLASNLNELSLGNVDKETKE